jgi:saccharopine dehydrogenase (NADP+, L-glutamate forming)
MAQPHIVLFGAGKSATCLIDYLLKEAAFNNWRITVADGNLQAAQSKIGNRPNAHATAINAENNEQRVALVQDADIVISLLPPALHYKVAEDCIVFKKNLLTASYVDDKIAALKDVVSKNNLLFLCEMGLDPGIDHMSAMQLIHAAKQSGAVITSFKSHCGGLIAPENDDNPWHYKVSWNPRNIVLAGKAGAVYKENGMIKQRTYQTIFTENGRVKVDNLHPLAWYPNRDSISYIPIYELETAHTFIRTTLRYEVFCKAWSFIVAAGLTNDIQPLQHPLTYAKWSNINVDTITDASIVNALSYLGLNSTEPIPPDAKTGADILQHLLETKLLMQPTDKDMIVMLHELEYEQRGKQYKAESWLVVKGEDSLRTAMAKTVGLPLGIAAKLILQKKILVKGLHIPVSPEIYEPVLSVLKEQGIVFAENKRML